MNECIMGGGQKRCVHFIALYTKDADRYYNAACLLKEVTESDVFTEATYGVPLASSTKRTSVLVLLWHMCIILNRPLKPWVC